MLQTSNENGGFRHIYEHPSYEASIQLFPSKGMGPQSKEKRTWSDLFRIPRKIKEPKYYNGVESKENSSSQPVYAYLPSVWPVQSSQISGNSERYYNSNDVKSGYYATQFNNVSGYRDTISPNLSSDNSQTPSKLNGKNTVRYTEWFGTVTQKKTTVRPSLPAFHSPPGSQFGDDVPQTVRGNVSNASPLQIQSAYPVCISVPNPKTCVCPDSGTYGKKKKKCKKCGRKTAEWGKNTVMESVSTVRPVLPSSFYSVPPIWGPNQSSGAVYKYPPNVGNGYQTKLLQNTNGQRSCPSSPESTYSVYNSNSSSSSETIVQDYFDLPKSSIPKRNVQNTFNGNFPEFEQASKDSGQPKSFITKPYNNGREGISGSAFHTDQIKDVFFREPNQENRNSEENGHIPPPPTSDLTNEIQSYSLNSSQEVDGKLLINLNHGGTEGDTFKSPPRDCTNVVNIAGQQILLNHKSNHLSNDKRNMPNQHGKPVSTDWDSLGRLFGDKDSCSKQYPNLTNGISKSGYKQKDHRLKEKYKKVQKSISTDYLNSSELFTDTYNAENNSYSIDPHSLLIDNAQLNLTEQQVKSILKRPNSLDTSSETESDFFLPPLTNEDLNKKKSVQFVHSKNDFLHSKLGKSIFLSKFVKKNSKENNQSSEKLEGLRDSRIKDLGVLSNEQRSNQPRLKNGAVNLRRAHSHRQTVETPTSTFKDTYRIRQSASRGSILSPSYFDKDGSNDKKIYKSLNLLRPSVPPPPPPVSSVRTKVSCTIQNSDTETPPPLPLSAPPPLPSNDRSIYSPGLEYSSTECFSPKNGNVSDLNDERDHLTTQESNFNDCSFEEESIVLNQDNFQCVSPPEKTRSPSSSTDLDDRSSEHIYEELPSITFSNEGEDVFQERSIFDGASKYEILKFLQGARDRVNVDPFEEEKERELQCFANDILNSSLLEDEPLETEDSIAESSPSESSDNVENTSENHCSQVYVNAEIERTDSGIGSESIKRFGVQSNDLSQTHFTPDDGLQRNGLNLCSDCDALVDFKSFPNVLMCSSVVCRRCSKRRQERKEILMEIFETEVKYGKDLTVIMEQFCRPIRVAGLLSSDQMDRIFLNIDKLIVHNRQFCRQIRDAFRAALSQGDTDLLSVNVAKLFLHAVPMLHQFQNYCVRQGSASILLQNLEKEKELLRIFLKVSQMENTLLRRMNLHSFLMVPVQRVTKYPLLLARLYNSTPPHHSSREDCRRAREKIELYLLHINNETKEMTPSKLWRKISMSVSNNSPSKWSKQPSEYNSTLRLRSIVLDILGWSTDEAVIVRDGRLQCLPPESSNWTRRGRALKFASVQLVLVTLGRPRHLLKEKLSEDGIVVPCDLGIDEGALLAFKENQLTKTALMREPWFLSRTVVTWDDEGETDCFELTDLESKETYIFQVRGSVGTKEWFRCVQFHALSVGSWRRRRGALANIMINGANQV